MILDKPVIQILNRMYAGGKVEIDGSHYTIIDNSIYFVAVLDAHNGNPGEGSDHYFDVGMTFNDFIEICNKQISKENLDIYKSKEMFFDYAKRSLEENI